MSDRESTLQALRDVHQFPGPFRFKVIGENTPEFVARVMQTVVLVVGHHSQPQVTFRESAHGRHQSISLTATLASAEQVLDVYAALRDVQGVRFLL